MQSSQVEKPKAVRADTDPFVGYCVWRKPNSTERRIFPGDKDVLKSRDTFFDFLQKEGNLSGTIRTVSYYLTDKTRIDIINDTDMKGFASRLGQHRSVEIALPLKIELSLPTKRRTESFAHYAAFDDAVDLIRVQRSFITQAACIAATVLLAFGAALSAFYSRYPEPVCFFGILGGLIYVVVMAILLVDSTCVTRRQTSRIMKRYNIDGTALIRRKPVCCREYPHCEDHEGNA
jgi:hypothetical protein